MTGFELAYLGLEPFFPPLYGSVRRTLLDWAKAANSNCRNILDVGGRKSHYTIGVPAQVSISDLPRETEVQQKLHLGVTEGIVSQTLRRRSNVQRVVLDDMTRSKFDAATFDCVVSVEVLEHVELDRDFVAEVHRVLRPGGRFLMTTPNGDAVKNTNPDHKRHYTRLQLEQLLSEYFQTVEVEYAVLDSRFRRWGLQSWSLRHPLRTTRTMLSNVVTRIHSSQSSVPKRALETRHLIARARKADEA